MDKNERRSRVALAVSTLLVLNTTVFHRVVGCIPGDLVGRQVHELNEGCGITFLSDTAGNSIDEDRVALDRFMTRLDEVHEGCRRQLPDSIGGFMYPRRHVRQTEDDTLFAELTNHFVDPYEVGVGVVEYRVVGDDAEHETPSEGIGLHCQ